MSDGARDDLAEGERAAARYVVGLPRMTLLGQSGIAVGRRAGASPEFRDHRDYQPGDDLRHVDWSAYARSDQLTVKQYHEEVTPHAEVLLDLSRSMALVGTAKARASRALAAFFAAAAANAGFTFQAWRLEEEVRPFENGSSVPPRWRDVEFTHRGSPFDGLARGGRRGRPRSLRFLVSDLLWEGEPLTVLRHLSEHAAATVVVQLLAAADDDPPLGGNLRLVDSETDEVRELHIDESVLRRYRDNLRRHQDNWHQACRRTGALFTTVVAERLLVDWRLDDLVAAEVLKVV
jgi:uncharacterized protein (DUF58 family)